MADIPQEPAFVRPESYASLRHRGLTPGQIRGPGWRRTSRGFFVPAGTVDSPMQRVANAAARLPTGGAVGTWAAALLHGVQWCDGYAPDGRTPLPVMLFTGPEAHVRALGCRVSQEPLPPTDTQHRYGIACTTPVRTCFDGMRLAADLEEAVAFADTMLAAEVVEVDDLEACIAGRTGWRGLPRARSAIALVDKRAKGPGRRDCGWSGCSTQGSLDRW